uniref:Uncharacterized protein n=1 Tax=Parascaris equorum TaxID=6256 RepID=A0A914R0I1_PAREQ
MATCCDGSVRFTTHISFPSIFSSRFVPSVTPSSTTKDTFILPFVPTTRSSSATASSTTLQQTGTANSQEVPVTLAEVPMIQAPHKAPKEAVMFDIFHNGQPVEAVVVGSRITLSFTPFYAIPR